MTPDTKQTVREIAIHHPATVRVFESLGIDYCCGGKRPLEEACGKANVPVERVLEMLAGVEPEAATPEDRSWAGASMAELSEHIVTRHHGYIRGEAPRLQALASKVVSRHGAAHPELGEIEELFSAMCEELFAHMMKEEHVLFPILRQMEGAAFSGGPAPRVCFDTIGMPIARMLADHEDAGALTARIRALANNFAPPEDACPSYRGLYHGLGEFERDLHRHIHLENNILFPRALEIEGTMREAAHGRA